MTEVMAIVRRGRAPATRKELERAGCAGYTCFPVLGRGRQRGLAGGGDGGLRFLAKVLFLIVVEDEQVEETVEAVVRANQTGEFGDGKVFVMETAASYRITESAPRDATA